MMSSNIFFNNSVGFFGFGGFLFVILIIWSLIWKGLALWKSAKRDDKIWFIVFLIANTVGILEILYLYVFTEKNKKPEKLSDKFKSDLDKI